MQTKLAIICQLFFVDNCLHLHCRFFFVRFVIMDCTFCTIKDNNNNNFGLLLTQLCTGVYFPEIKYCY